MPRARLAVVSPGRTSSGGSAFAQNLAGELDAILGEDVVLAGIPATGSATLPEPVATAETIVFLGARVVDHQARHAVFWPLNVAPLDHSINYLPHTTVRNRARHLLLRARYGQSVRRADALVFGSHYARALYTTAFAAAAPLPYAVIPGGTPSVRRVERPANPRLPDGRRLVLCCSHLYPYKGILQFVSALGRVRDQLPADLLVRIAGADRDVRYAAAVRAKVAELGLGQLVEVSGATPEELAELYGQAELCVFPSTCENAGSFALFDGFHAGVPTICSDRSSMPEMARGAAILVNPHDERALGEAILDVLGSPTEQERLAAAAREWSRTAPTWATRAAALVHFVDGLSR